MEINYKSRSVNTRDHYKDVFPAVSWTNAAGIVYQRIDDGKPGIIKSKFLFCIRKCKLLCRVEECFYERKNSQNFHSTILAMKVDQN